MGLSLLSLSCPLSPAAGESHRNSQRGLLWCIWSCDMSQSHKAGETGESPFILMPHRPDAMQSPREPYARKTPSNDVLNSEQRVISSSLASSAISRRFGKTCAARQKIVRKTQGSIQKPSDKMTSSMRCSPLSTSTDITSPDPVPARTPFVAASVLWGPETINDLRKVEQDGVLLCPQEGDLASHGRRYAEDVPSSQQWVP
ncbi:hypothetical protein OE88DRAFT_144683 [Heliocybe sulcata]|uniref:Ig-like domain-containing protein n=1 Tax=Heliocybe sulcata TaxID=5364 RepID=A0A5C3NJE3_9AGAM|nr:hypothetical protein OE88DRAFT_144683 [Heliocybe sulcata]